MTAAPGPVVGPVVGLVSAPEPDGDGLRELLRVLAALVACDRPCRLVTIEGARGVLDGDDLDDEAERLLEGLAAFDVRPVHLEGPALCTLLEGASALLRLGAADRPGEPPLLVRRPESGGSEPILNAGQVVLALP